MYLRLFVVPNRFLSVCLPTFFLNSKKHVRRCGDKPIYIGAVLEDGGKNYMAEDESKMILSEDWKELIVEDAKTKEKLVIINSDGVEITSSHLSVRLVPKARINPDELKVLAKPLQEYLTSHFNPMCSVVVDVDRVTVVSKELSTPTD
jgi:hypothetical protein